MRNWWMWILGVPVGLFVLVMATGVVQSDDTAREQAGKMVIQCQTELAAAQKAQLPAAAGLADFCDRFRADFVKKYGTTP